MMTLKRHGARAGNFSNAQAYARLQDRVSSITPEERAKLSIRSSQAKRKKQPITLAPVRLSEDE